MTPCTLLIAALSSVILPQGQDLLNLEQASGRGSDRVSFREVLPRWSWAPDGQALVLEEEQGRRWFDPATLQEQEPILEDGPKEKLDDRTRAAALYAEAFGVSDEEALGEVRGRVTTVGDGTLVQRGSDAVWLLAGSPARGGHLVEAELAELSPQGDRVAFVREHDLHVIDLASAEERSLTETGTKDRLNGKLDWVYQEEVYGRGNFKGWWWSPDGRFITFLSLDESPVQEFTVVDHIEEGHFRVEPEITHYPKAGDGNPITSLGLCDVSKGTTSWLDLSPWEAEEPLVTRVFWTPDSRRCLVAVQNRIQSWMRLLAVAPETGKATTWTEEQREAGWVDRLEAPLWLEDGRTLLLSERDGYRHVYLASPEGDLTQLTDGAWEVVAIRHVDEEAGTLLLETRFGDATGTQWLEVRLDGSRTRRLTQDRGTHRLDFNGDRTLFLDWRSSLAEPTEVRLCRSADGAILRVLGRATVPAEERFGMARWERVTIPTRDGFELDAQLMKPRDFDPAQRYPVWVPTYSGPDAPTVRDSWSSSAWEQFLAQQGVIVMKVNVRTASRKGQEIIEQGYGRFGVLEVQDMCDAIDWLCANDWADETRVGITGYSYGGFMTARCLLTSDRFRLGIAGGGVYDWRMYDSIYTERYMSTPERNPRGYVETSCIPVAGNLTGFLHLHHGVMDDNVHVQQMFHMAHALMKSGQTTWSMMAYPQTRHGIRDRDLAWHARQTEWRLIQEHLRPPGPAGDVRPSQEFDELLEAGR